MDPMHKAMMQAMLSTERAAAQAEVLEGVIADFFRLYLATETSSTDEIRTALGMLSEKLLAQQAQAMQAKDAGLKAASDIKTAMAEQRQQLKEQVAADQAKMAEQPKLTAVPSPTGESRD